MIPTRGICSCSAGAGAISCLFSKRLERGCFVWPSTADGVLTISPAQLGYLKGSTGGRRKKPGDRFPPADAASMAQAAKQLRSRP